MTPPARPYAFPTLLEGAAQTFAVIGTGLSYPDCPTADELGKKRVRSATKLLGLPDPIPAPEDQAFDLYVWAETALELLKSPDKDESRLRWELAKALGLLDDLQWFGNVGLPIRGNTPRHRALARLIIEGRFSAFYCLNWDALMDRALESVGLKEIRRLEDSPPVGRPWILTAYARVIHAGHQTRVTDEKRVFPLFKPHGCVEELRSGAQQVVFKITSTDLQLQPDQEQRFIEGRLSVLAGGKPILGIGWKAGEGYLRNAILATEPANSDDAFILASRSWYPCNHGPIAQHRNSNMFQAHAAVGNPNQPTTDTLFPWLFARYVLRKLSSAAAPADRQYIENLAVNLDAPEKAVKKDPLVLWCDDWLPAWVRLCWQVGAMEGCDPATNQEICPHDIPLGPPDLHIPLTGISNKRQDLKAAAQLLVTLSNQGHFDYTQFPGALWDRRRLHLILPLPTWGDLAQFNDLAGLKNLFTALRQHGLGAVRKVSLLALAPGDAPPIDALARNKLAALVARRMTHFAYARSADFDWLKLEDLKGEAHE